MHLEKKLKRLFVNHLRGGGGGNHEKKSKSYHNVDIKTLGSEGTNFNFFWRFWKITSKPLGNATRAVCKAFEKHKRKL